jgi:hypothetical protein
MDGDKNAIESAGKHEASERGKNLADGNRRHDKRDHEHGKHNDERELEFMKALQALAIRDLACRRFHPGLRKRKMHCDRDEKDRSNDLMQKISCELKELLEDDHDRQNDVEKKFSAQLCHCFSCSVSPRCA